MADRRVVINLHSSADTVPHSELYFGELVVSHNSKGKTNIYTKVTNPSDNTDAGKVAKFIDDVQIDEKIGVVSAQSKSDYEELAGIVQSLANITITDIKATSPISASTNALVTEPCGNTVTIMHVTGSQQSGFNKLESDAYGHITGGTNVTIGDISGLTGFQKSVRDVETKLSSGTTGTGNVVKGIGVSDHTITAQMGSISSGDVTDFVAGVKSSESQLSTASTENTGNAITNITVNGHVITIDKAKTFSENGHKHSGEDITGGTVGISYLPTATTVTSSDETVPTSKAVQDAIDQATLDGVRYKGTTGDTPTTAKVGDEYMASQSFTIPADRSGSGSATTVEAGDYIIARTSGTTSKFDVKEKNLDGAVTSTGMTSGQVVIADGERIIKSQALSATKVGSADTSTNLDSAPVISIDSATKIKVTAGNKTSKAITVPFATSASSIDLSGVKNADDLKAIEALNGATGILRKTNANTWDLAEVVTDLSSVSATGKLVDAYTVKQAINSGGTSVQELSGSVETLSGSVVSIENSLVNYASAITINDTVHTVSNNAVDLGDYLSASTIITINGSNKSVSGGKFDLGSFLSASTAHITTIQQSSTASAVTTTINYVTDASVASAATITQDLIIDCGTY